ncbi:MAG: glycosyltransferase family A protein [Gemmatimonadaceae bacterium]
MPSLTIGIPTYDDFSGVYFTVQALRLYHDLDDTELLVVDNFGCQHTRAFVEKWSGARYVLARDVVGTAAAKNVVFREARGEAVLCCDGHVLIVPGAIAKLRAFYRQHPDCGDLLQGPLLYDDARSISTHLDSQWLGELWGTWQTDARGLDPNAEPFEIPMQGLGAFSCRRDSWLGFNPDFRGFGGEEGYLHEKYRQAGQRTLCLPWLRWMHRFGRPGGAPYAVLRRDKLRNYAIGHAELGLDLMPMVRHFSEHAPAAEVIGTIEEALEVSWLSA